jgi:hypothetical protein
MRVLIWAGVVCVGVAYASRAEAEPRVDIRATYERASQLTNSGAAEQALTVIDEGLAVDPKDLPLLGLKGTVLLSLHDYAGALATYKAYLDAGARGANRREAEKIIENLGAVKSTFLDVAVSNGPATVYLDSTSHRPVCDAAPPCHKVVLPGQYKVIADRSGFERWTGQITVVNGETAKLAVTLVEKPSLLTVRVAQPGARITVDDVVYDAPTTVPAGTHRVAVSLAGRVTARLQATAHEGKPVALDVALAALVPVHLSPPGAHLALDGKALTIEDGGIAVPPGAHALVASADGFLDRRVDVPAARSDDYQITVELALDTHLAWLTTRRKIAISAGGVGVGAMVTGVVLGLQSRGLDHDTFARCPSPSEPCRVALEANDLNRRARTRATQANIAFGVAGGAAIAAGILWLAGAPESRVQVAPRLDPRTGDVAGLDLSVRF